MYGDFVSTILYEKFALEICIVNLLENSNQEFVSNICLNICTDNLFGNLFKNLQKRIEKKNGKKELKKKSWRKIFQDKNVFSGREKLNFARLPVVYRLNNTLTDKYAIVALVDAEKRLKLRWLVITKNPWLWLHIVWVIK